MNESGRRKIGAGKNRHQLLPRRLRVVDHHQAGVDDFAEVVRRNVGGHAHCNTGRSVDEKIRELRRKNGRLAQRTVVVRNPVDCLFVDVVTQQLFGETREPHFGVAHRRRRIIVERAEVALTVDKLIAHRKILRHAYNGVVDRAVAMRMELAHHVADDARRFLVRLAGRVSLLVHAVKDAAMHGLESVANVGKRAADDDRHRVVEIRRAHLVFDVDGHTRLVEVLVVVVFSHVRFVWGRHSCLPFERRHSCTPFERRQECLRHTARYRGFSLPMRCPE